MDKRRGTDERGDWEKAISSKLQDYEPSNSNLPPLHLPARKLSFSKRKWLGIAASIAAVVIFVLFIIRDNTQEAVPDLSSPLSSTRVVAGSNVGIKTVPSSSNELSGVPSAPKNLPVPPNNTPAIAVTDDGVSNEVLTENTNDLIAQNNDTDGVNDSTTDDLLNGSSGKPKDGNLKIPPPTKRSIRLSVFTSGLSLNTDAASMTKVGDDVATGHPIECNEYSVHETPMLEIGSAILFPITRQWSLQTGLKYSWYRIELRSGAGDNHVLDVHSLGIPLDVQYTFYSSKVWRAYGQYGWGIGIPLKSTITGLRTRDGGATVSLDTSLALGLEYSINNIIGLYSSLGVSYDFLQMKSNLPDADISRWHGAFEVGIRFRVNR